MANEARPRFCRTISIGMSLKGSRWRRPQDVVGLALAWDGLSAAHSDEEIDRTAAAMREFFL